MPIAHYRWKNHPRAGVDFPDSAPAAVESEVFRSLIDDLAARLPTDAEVVAGIDLGGFGFAGALAFRNGLGVLEVRKVSAMRADLVRTFAANFALGDGVAISTANRVAGRCVAVLDDCLMSGETALAAVQLLRRMEARCDTALFVFDLIGLGGRERLEHAGVRVHVLESLPIVASG